MADLTEEQLRRAEGRGRGVREAEPRATAAHYDPAAGRVVIDLANGCAYAFPTQRVQDLQGANEEDLANVEVDGAGFNLHWPKLDVDLYVPALVAGVFGTRAWIARELARVAGRVRSPAKAAAARSNGAKGGRPRKAANARQSLVAQSCARRPRPGGRGWRAAGGCWPISGGTSINGDRDEHRDPLDRLA